MFINYAHRGASEYAPENTMSAFYLGILQGANGIETDVRRTKDGVLVLFHDKNLLRVTGHEGAIADYNYRDLLQLRIRNAKTNTEDILVKLEDFLRYFAFRDLQFAIELKDADIESDVLALLERFEMKEKTVVTSFKFDYIKRFKSIAPSYRVGYLTDDFVDQKLADMKMIGGEQLCPKAESVTAEKTECWHRMGFSVRAWGVADTALMERVYACGADGMTVNFPDLLTAHIAKE